MRLSGKVAIAGIGHTEYGKGLAASERELAAHAVTAALDDAGIAAREVDALISYTMENVKDFELARDVGFGPIHFFSQMPHGGGAGPAAIGHASLAIASGQARTAVVWRARKRSGQAARVWSKADGVLQDHWKWSRPSGILRPVDEVALLTRRYNHVYGDTSDALAEIVTTFRQYANANPHAMMRDKYLSRDDYFNSRLISSPLRLLDNCLESDGAAALVLVSAERARDTRRSPVLVEAFAQGIAPGHQSMADFHRSDSLKSSSWFAAAKLWAQTELTPADVDLAQFYDAFSPLILFSLEAYGFAERGQGADFILSRGIHAGGALPVNTAGGSLSEAYLHGMNLLVEAVRQLRGHATSQVDRARTALVTGCDATPTSALLLRNEG